MRTRIPLALVVAAVVAAVMMSLAGCGSGSSPVQTSAGRLGILLTDAPSPFEQVLVTINEVQVHAPGGSWTTVVTKQDIDAVIPQPIDLLSLRNLEKLVGVGTLPAGLYTQLRLVLLPEAEVVLPGGEHRPLTIPSGPETGLKALNFTVPEGRLVYLLIDIQTDRIVPPAGTEADYILPPTAISVTVHEGPFGSLRGTVSPADSDAVVTAFWAGTDMPVAQTTISDTGAWELPNLLPASYYLLASTAGFEPFDSRPTTYEVIAGAETDVPPITLTPTP